MAELDDGYAPPQQPQQPQRKTVTQPPERSSNELDPSFTPAEHAAQAAPEETWTHYAGNPEHNMAARVGAAGLVEAGRIGQGIYNTAHNIFSGPIIGGNLARDTGAATRGDYGPITTDDPSSGHGTPELAGRVLDAASVLGPTGDLMTGESLGAKMVKSQPAKPSAAELYDVGDSQYKAMRNLDVNYTASGLGDLAAGLRNNLHDDSLYHVNAPKTHWFLDQFEGLGDQAAKEGAQPGDSVGVPIGYVDKLRGVLSRTLRGPNRHTDEGAAAASALRGIDGFLAKPPEGSVFSGPAEKAGELARLGRGNWGAAKRSDLLTGVEEGADFQASAANSGRNYDNILRQRVRPYLDPSIKAKNLNGFNEPERAAVANIDAGDRVRNSLRVAGNMTGGGGGIGSTLVGVLAGDKLGPAGYALPVAGWGIKKVQNALAQRSLNKADELVRSRSPLHAERQAAAPMTLQPDAPGIAAVKAISPANANNIDNDPGYAKGGAVKGRPTHEFLVARLMRLAEEAKRAEKASTKPILDVPDSTVAKALAKAQEAI